MGRQSEMNFRYIRKGLYHNKENSISLYRVKKGWKATIDRDSSLAFVGRDPIYGYLALSHSIEGFKSLRHARESDIGSMVRKATMQLQLRLFDEAEPPVFQVQGYSSLIAEVPCLHVKDIGKPPRKKSRPKRKDPAWFCSYYNDPC